jgi:hypothetical protein
MSYRYRTELRRSEDLHYHGLLWCHRLARIYVWKSSSVWPAITQRVRNGRNETVALPAVDSAECCLVCVRNQVSPFAVLCRTWSDTCQMNTRDDLESDWGRQTVSVCYSTLLFAVVLTTRSYLFIIALLFYTVRYRTTAFAVRFKHLTLEVTKLKTPWR